ncbi:sulfur globule protein CV3 domain protein [Teladorsagia circumcincta]|uniref:Sulfur globule protein CV3 domain protein n=1 Tax=Teladorsagia circumcincta TaxID=45464 RepID=A0A2G9UKQ8_TELCI|nr:sulfur globule protein CV3 domain protein [Teladorsagia circumcincta]
MRLFYILLPLIVSIAATPILVPAAKIKEADKIAIPEPTMDPKKGVFCIMGGYYPYGYYYPYCRYRPYFGYGPYRYGPYYRYWG